MPSAEYQREWRRKNPDKQAGYNRKYRSANKELINSRERKRYRLNNGKEKARRWQTANREAVREAHRRYRQKPDTRAKELKYQRQWVAANPTILLVSQARRRARKCGLDFNLVASDIVIPDACPVLGIPIEKGCAKAHPGSPTIDRIDNTAGYIRGNVMVISYRANTMKNAATLQELRKFVDFYGDFLNERDSASASS